MWEKVGELRRRTWNQGRTGLVSYELSKMSTELVVARYLLVKSHTHNRNDTERKSFEGDMPCHYGSPIQFRIGYCRLLPGLNIVNRLLCAHGIACRLLPGLKMVNRLLCTGKMVNRLLGIDCIIITNSMSNWT